LDAARTSYVEIRLTARDRNGLGKRVTQRLDPLRVTTTFSTSPTGLDLQIEGENFQAPVSLETWAGDRLSVVAPDQVGDDGTPYVYTGWSDGGRRSHLYTVPTANGSVTASFAQLNGVRSTPLGDARVRESGPNANDGGSTGLTVRGGTTSDYETLMRFRVAGTSGTIERAVIYLYAYEGTVDGPAIYRTSASWSESRVTWNNRPGPITRQLDNAGPIARRSWVAYDVTDAISGNGTYSFLVRGTSTDAVSWYSREATGNRPLLVVSASGIDGASVDEARGEADPTASATVEPTETATAAPTETPTVEPTAAPTETPAPTAVLEPATPEPLPVDDGFEGDLVGWHSEGVALVAGAAADGSTAARLTATGSADVVGTSAFLLRQVGPDASEVFLSAEMAMVAQDEQAARLLTVYGPDAAEIVSIFSAGNGNIGVMYAMTGQTEYVAAVPLLDWVTIELHVAIAGDGTARADVWLDGVLVRSDTLATAAARVDAVQVGHRATDRSYDLLVDDVQIDRMCTLSCPTSAPAVETPNSDQPVVADDRDDAIERSGTPTEKEE
jgi:hypothetical protein